METRKLDTKEINQLFDFCKKRNVKEYEIQVELVDHLASSIEKELNQNIVISFQEALNTAYQDFGENGFDEIVKAKRKMFHRKYNMLFYKYLATFFQLPRILLTLILTALLYSLLIYLNNDQIIWEILGSIAILLNLTFNIATQAYRDKKEPTFLLTYYFKRLRMSITTILTGLFIAALHIFNYFSIFSVFRLAASFFIISVFITLYILAVYIPKHLKKDFVAQHPYIPCPIL